MEHQSNLSFYLRKINPNRWQVIGPDGRAMADYMSYNDASLIAALLRWRMRCMSGEPVSDEEINKIIKWPDA